jgi:hypothetical protein
MKRPCRSVDPAYHCGPVVKDEKAVAGWRDGGHDEIREEPYQGEIIAPWRAVTEKAVRG